jgi:hypothetical protein
MAKGLPVEIEGYVPHIMLTEHQNVISALLTASRMPETHKAQMDVCVHFVSTACSNS